MAWNISPCYYTQRMIFKHGVELVGWPAGLDFGNPNGMTSIPKLTRILDALQYKRMRLVKLELEEQDAAAHRQHTDLAVARMSANREDAGTKRPIRGEATRSKRLRKGDVKSPYEVPKGYDKATPTSQ